MCRQTNGLEIKSRAEVWRLQSCASSVFREFWRTMKKLHPFLSCRRGTHLMTTYYSRAQIQNDWPDSFLFLRYSKGVSSVSKMYHRIDPPRKGNTHDFTHEFLSVIASKTFRNFDAEFCNSHRNFLIRQLQNSSRRKP